MTSKRVTVPLAIIEPDLGVVRQVLEFFVHNRIAADTLEGIARWRLVQQEVRRNVQQTEKALEWLVNKGLVEELRPPGYRASVFRLNPERQKDAVRFLANQKKDQDKK